MGIKSKQDWSGTIVNGITLGEPAIHEDGTLEWDGGVGAGFVDVDGYYQDDGFDSDGSKPAKVKFDKMKNVKLKVMAENEPE